MVVFVLAYLVKLKCSGFVVYTEANIPVSLSLLLVSEVSGTAEVQFRKKNSSLTFL